MTWTKEDTKDIAVCAGAVAPILVCLALAGKVAALVALPFVAMAAGAGCLYYGVLQGRS